MERSDLECVRLARCGSGAASAPINIRANGLFRQRYGACAAHTWCTSSPPRGAKHHLINTKTQSHAPIYLARYLHSLLDRISAIPLTQCLLRKPYATIDIVVSNAPRQPVSAAGAAVFRAGPLLPLRRSQLCLLFSFFCFDFCGAPQLRLGVTYEKSVTLGNVTMSHRTRERLAECLASLSHSTMIGLPRAQH
ncbi:hypothetical protein EVAR_26409_1 [Eumeta japonica]|uniref:Uncharacterized protein n=1 Tax=Eumeta variegata TaxID=151549 RepID=A0A4C1VNP9_EUMVA|nr:hypothetical protein EVAR_26409_1 [Eumeta japonica]